MLARSNTRFLHTDETNRPKQGQSTLPSVNLWIGPYYYYIRPIDTGLRRHLSKWPNSAQGHTEIMSCIWRHKYTLWVGYVSFNSAYLTTCYSPGTVLPLELTGIRLRVSTADKYWHAKVYYPQRCSLPAGSFGPFLFITWFLGPPWVHTPVFESTYFTFPFRFQNNATFTLKKWRVRKS